MTIHQRIEKLEKAVQMLVLELYGPNRGGLSEATVKEIYEMCHTTTGEEKPAPKSSKRSLNRRDK